MIKQGNLKYEKRLVAFIDVLGFKNIIDKSIKDKSRIKAITDFITEVRDDFCVSERKLNRYKEEGRQNPNEVMTRKVTQFSDSLVVSYREDEESAVFHMLHTLFFLHFSALQRSMLIRGCVVRGELFHTDELLFGPALVDAVEKEKALASYPRIVCDNSVIELGGVYHQKHHEPAEEQKYIFNLLTKDSDGLYYINYFTGIEEESDDGYDVIPYHLQKLKSIITEMAGVKSPSVYSKYLWLIERYNETLKHYKKLLNPLKVSEDLADTASFVQSLTSLNQGTAP